MEVKLGVAYLSPLRSEKRESFVLNRAPTGHIYWTDMGTGDWGSPEGLVMKLYGLTYPKAVIRIKEDLVFNKPKEIKEFKPQVKIVERSKYVFSVDPRPFNRKDKAYWTDYGITLETLKKYHVAPCRRLAIYENKIAKSVFYERPSEPQYSFNFDGNYKIYRPYSKVKWLSNISQTDVQGLKQLPKEEKLLVITKSLKDVMLFQEMSIPAVAPHSEVSFLPAPVLDDLKKRFKTIIIWFDEDKTGKEMATKFSQLHMLRTTFTGISEAKDITDYFKLFGATKTQNLLREKLDIA